MVWTDVFYTKLFTFLKNCVFHTKNRMRWKLFSNFLSYTCQNHFFWYIGLKFKSILILYFSLLTIIIITNSIKRLTNLSLNHFWLLSNETLLRNIDPRFYKIWGYSVLYNDTKTDLLWIEIVCESPLKSSFSLKAHVELTRIILLLTVAGTDNK